MKNIFNKTNAPYFVSGALATLALVSSGVVGVLTAAAVFNASLPLVASLVGFAVFSAATIALSAVAINKNNTISKKDAQKEKFESCVAARKKEEANEMAELKKTGIVSKDGTIALPYPSPENQLAGNDKVSNLRKLVGNGAELSKFLSDKKLEMVKQSLQDPANKEKNVATQQSSSDSKVIALPYKDAETPSPKGQQIEEKSQSWTAWGLDGAKAVAAVKTYAPYVISTVLTGLTMAALAVEGPECSI